MKEIIFSYNNQRCHATIVDHLLGEEEKVGELNGYAIYKIPMVVFDQFGFVAITAFY